MGWPISIVLSDIYVCKMEEDITIQNSSTIFPPNNESFVKTFISKLNHFTTEKYKFNIVWNTRKVQSLFPLRDKVDHYSCIIYWGDCSCDQTCIGEAVLNVKIQ